MQALARELCNGLLACADDESAIGLIDSFDSVDVLRTQTTEPLSPSCIRWGSTALHIICEVGLMGALRHALDMCSDYAFVNARMDDGATALYLTTALDRNWKTPQACLEMVRVLVERGADPFVARIDLYRGATPLYAACENNLLECAEYLLGVMLSRVSAVDACEAIVYNEVIGSTILHASVLNRGIIRGARVCRWLTGPECATLWPGGKLSDFLTAKRSHYPLTPLQEAVSSWSPSLEAVRLLLDLGACVENTAAFILDTLVASVARRMGDSIEVDIQVVELLYDRASRLPDFAACDTHSALLQIMQLVRVQGLRPRCGEVRQVASLVSRLMSAHPSLFADDRVRPSKHRMLRDLGRRRDADDDTFVAPRICLLVLLGWIPHDAKHMRTMFCVASGCIDADICLQYVRQFVARGDRNTLIDDDLLYSVMGNRDRFSAQSWPLLVDHVMAIDPDARSLLHRLASRIVLHSKTLNVNGARFLRWAFDRKVVPPDFPVAHAVCHAEPQVSTSLFEFLWPTHSASIICFQHLTTMPSLLGMVLWNTRLTPTDVFARTLAQGGYRGLSRNFELSDFMRHTCWVYTFRELVKEQGVLGRIVLGPKRSAASTQPLPRDATLTLIEFLWRGRVTPL